MSRRIYLLPVAGDGISQGGFFPKYLTAIAGSWQQLDYGQELWTLVSADVTNAEQTSISANADVTAVPANLDQQVGGALATVQAKLEAANLPADWVTSGMTYRTVLKWSIRLMLLMQRFHGLDTAADRFFASGLTLDSTIGDIPTTPRQRVNTAATSFGLDTSSLTLATPIRTAFRVLAQQMTFAVTVAGEAV